MNEKHVILYTFNCIVYSTIFCCNLIHTYGILLKYKLSSLNITQHSTSIKNMLNINIYEIKNIMINFLGENNKKNVFVNSD